MLKLEELKIRCVEQGLKDLTLNELEGAVNEALAETSKWRQALEYYADDSIWGDCDERDHTYIYDSEYPQDVARVALGMESQADTREKLFAKNQIEDSRRMIANFEQAIATRCECEPCEDLNKRERGYIKNHQENLDQAIKTLEELGEPIPEELPVEVAMQRRRIPA